MRATRPHAKVTESKTSTVSDLSFGRECLMRNTDIERVCVCVIGTIRSELQSSLQYTEVPQPDL